MHAVCLSLVLLSAAPDEIDASVVVLAEGRVVPAAGWSIRGDGELVVASAGDGDAQAWIVVPSPALLDASPGGAGNGNGRDEASSGRSPQGALARSAGFPTAVMHLANGEVLHGSLAEPDEPGTVRFDTREFGPQRLALGAIAAIRLVGRRIHESAGHDAGDAPCLVLTNGDVLPGAIKAITPEAVTVDSAFGQTDTELARVAAVVLAPDPPPTDGRRAGQLICSLADGQRCYVDALAPGSVEGRLQLRRAGASVDLPRSAVRRVVFSGWTVRELIALDPPAVETTPYFGETVRLEIDDAKHRRPRAIGGRSFLGGITARPRSRVSYTLKRPAAYLVGWVGLDPLRGRAGICDLRVDSDGAALVRFAGLTARAGARRIVVPATGLDRITLTTDFGARGELGDCVNWCELLLVEKNKEATNEK